MYEEIQKELQAKLSEKRFLHSIGTMKMAQKLAIQHGEDENIAALTGLLHDIGKELSSEESLNYVNKNNIVIDEIEKQVPSLLHGKIGAHMAKEKYQITPSMQDAISYHTTGNPSMNKLAKIIYVADKTEETRDFEDIEMIRKLAFEDLDEAVLYILNFDIQKNIRKEKIIHPNSILTRNKLLLQRKMKQ